MTGRDLVTASLRLLGVVAPGESMAASEATEGLASLNRLISSWSNESLMIYARVRETPFTLTPGTATVTMGAAGNLTNRPQAIESATIQDAATGIETPVNLLTQAEYAAIVLKTQTSTYPTDLYDDGGYPLRTLTLYPVPSAAHKLVVYTARILTAVATLDTDISLPPGYERALTFNLAVEMSPEYGKPVPDVVMMTATESKALIKRMNHKPGMLLGDPALARGDSYNIYTGGSPR